jgi:hypothetical protein
VILAVVLAAALVLPGLRPSPGSKSAYETLAPVGWVAASLPFGQYAAITFITGSNENLTGSFLSSNTISVYVMTSAQFDSLVKHSALDGYEWTTGQVWTGNISTTVPAGDWVLVFLNTNKYGTSGVVITAAVVLTKE